MAGNIFTPLERIIADMKARQAAESKITESAARIARRQIKRLNDRLDTAMGEAKEYREMARRYQREMLETRRELSDLRRLAVESAHGTEPRNPRSTKPGVAGSRGAE